MSFRFICLCCIVLSLSSCKDDKKQDRGAIVLGDSATIVTETDPNLLKDFVDDIKVQVAEKDTVKIAQQAQEPSEPLQRPDQTNLPVNQEPQQPVSAAKGLTVAFKEVTVFIPGIETKTYRQQNLKQASGASYQLVKGDLKENEIHISGASVTKVSQRYTTAVIAKNELGTLKVDGLANTTEWRTLRGKNNVYPFRDLEQHKLDFKRATPSQIKSAVTRAAKNKRLSKQMIRKWEGKMRNVRTVDQKPFTIQLQSVMWKVEGKDANGKPFQKQVRIDL